MEFFFFFWSFSVSLSKNRKEKGLKTLKKNIDSLFFFSPFFISIQNLHDCLRLRVGQVPDNRERTEKPLIRD